MHDQIHMLLVAMADFDVNIEQFLLNMLSAKRKLHPVLRAAMEP